jgi:signal transduction histidine kinase
MPETIRYYIIGFVIAFLLLGCFIILLAALYSRKQMKNRKEKLKMQAQFSDTLLHSQLEIKEQTLRHISWELHDNFGQIASLIKINLNTFSWDDQVKGVKKIEDTKELVRQLISDIKTLSISLDGDRISQSGLAKAIQLEIDRLNRTGHFEAIFGQEGELPLLSNERTIILFRMVQEILNNMIKHSGARQISVFLSAEEKSLKLALSDDGVGFDLEERKNSGGAGLRNLENRARLIQADLVITTAPGSGTEIIINLLV